MTLQGLDGARWRATHQSSVDAILASTGLTRRVASFGSRFYNEDNWSGRRLLAAIADDPESGQLQWLAKANEAGADPRIVIASTPDDLPQGLAMALVGGAYHEAWHTLYSRRRPLQLKDISGPLTQRFAVKDAPFWASSRKALLDWSNIIEDIRIERLGCRRFPGTGPKMVDLQDLILKMERDGRPDSTGGLTPVLTPAQVLQIVASLFRDLGLGYTSPAQRAALIFYDRVCPEARQIVNGPLKPFLDRAISLGRDEDLESGWLAMDILLALRAISEGKCEGEQGEQGEPGEGKQGEGEPGESKQGEGEPGESKIKIECEGEPGEGEGEPGEGEGEPGEGEPGEGEGEPGEGEQGEGEQGEGKQGEGKQDAKVGSKGGGHSVLNDQQIRELVVQLLAAMAQQGVGITDGSKALEDAITAHVNRDLDDRHGETPWRPAYPEFDSVHFARKQDSQAALKIRAAVRKEIAALRSRLRVKFLAARTSSQTHGVRKGVGLSERRIVDSVIEIMSGVAPNRPDFTRNLKNDCSLAVALIIDESGSMSSLRKDTVKAAVAIADALASLGCPILVAGPRNAAFHHSYQYEDVTDCHRVGAVQIDVFKDWNESMVTALPRFPGITANGSTPLEDGIQYALQVLNKRPERHRVVLVITDGCPDHASVVRHQIRVARDARIDIVGIGIGGATAHVKDLFDQAITVADVPSLPKALATCLEGLIFPAHAKKIRLNGGFATNRGSQSARP